MLRRSCWVRYYRRGWWINRSYICRRDYNNYYYGRRGRIHYLREFSTYLELRRQYFQAWSTWWKHDILELLFTWLRLRSWRRYFNIHSLVRRSRCSFLIWYWSPRNKPELCWGFISNRGRSSINNSKVNFSRRIRVCNFNFCRINGSWFSRWTVFDHFDIRIWYFSHW
jgi:hypothetical protein